MPTLQLQVRRYSVVSSRPFDQVLERFMATIGQPDPHEFHDALVAATTASALEAVVHAAIGASGLMEFARFDAGAVLHQASAGPGPGPGRKLVRLLIGNPLIMAAMAVAVPDAAAYAPVTILIDERSDGVHLSYDSMASLLASYESSEALKVARDLDTKIEGLLETAAA